MAAFGLRPNRGKVRRSSFRSANEPLQQADCPAIRELDLYCDLFGILLRPEFMPVSTVTSNYLPPAALNIVMYTNPGSGLFLIQIVLAAGLTAAYRFRHALIGVFGRKRKLNSDSGT